MKRDLRCPNLRCNALLMKREGTVAYIKCRKCKEERKFDFDLLANSSRYAPPAWST